MNVAEAARDNARSEDSMKLSKGYKVIRLYGKQYISAHIAYKTNDPNVWKEYRFNHWTKRHKTNGPLACFATLADAKWYIRNNPDPASFIFQCEYIQSRDTDLWYSKTRYKDHKFLWKPPSTRTADQIRILSDPILL